MRGERLIQLLSGQHDAVKDGVRSDRRGYALRKTKHGNHDQNGTPPLSVDQVEKPLLSRADMIENFQIAALTAWNLHAENLAAKLSLQIPATALGVFVPPNLLKSAHDPGKVRISLHAQAADFVDFAIEQPTTKQPVWLAQVQLKAVPRSSNKDSAKDFLRLVTYTDGGRGTVTEFIRGLWRFNKLGFKEVELPDHAFAHIIHDIGANNVFHLDKASRLEPCSLISMVDLRAAQYKVDS